VNIRRATWGWGVAGISACALVACGGGGGGGGYNVNGSSTGGTTSGTSYAATTVVSDAGATPYTDARLINAWGIAFNPQGFVWVANNGSSTSTLYDGNGVPQSLVVSIPAGQSGNASPSGIVFNGSADFVVSQGGVSGASNFIFVGEAGTVAGWSPGVNLNSAATVFDGGAAGKVYKGAAIAAQGSSHFLYATDFHNGTVDVFDAGFNRVATTGGFSDPGLPVGYAPFGIQAIGNLIYVAYAKQDAQAHDDVAGIGLGVVDVFDTSGKLMKQLVPAGGALNAPWGLAMAPANFGPFSNALLVGNFGDGRINAFDPATGAVLGFLSKADGSAIVIDGLWGIAFGNCLNNQPANTLFFAAGPGAEAHGAYGRIDNH
jgi:uncharacterized protein (TIGR03118 family)